MSAWNRYALARALGFLRSRMLGAVTLPALIGAAWAARRGGGLRALGKLPEWADLLLVLAGLAAVELMNLFGADYLEFMRRRKGEAPSGPVLPGNPVAKSLPPRLIPPLLLLLALAGAAVLLYFLLTVGAGVLAFLLPAAGLGALYVFCPFPYAFLATALVPPLITGGAAYVLAGRAEAASFLAGLPVTWISVGVILTYRVAYAGERESGARRLIALSPYGAAVLNIGLLALAGLYPVLSLVSLILFPPLMIWAGRLLAAERKDCVPATAVGVFLHSSVSLVLALALLLG